MVERGPLGFRRPLGKGPLAGEDAVVAARLSGGAPEVDEPVESPDDVPQIVSVLADAVASQTREFLDFTQSSSGGKGTREFLVSQAPVAVGKEFDHYVITLYYPDSRISIRDRRDIRNEIQLRVEQGEVESINIMRV